MKIRITKAIKEALKKEYRDKSLYLESEILRQQKELKGKIHETYEAVQKIINLENYIIKSNLKNVEI